MSNVPFGQGKGPFNSFPGVFSKDLILDLGLGQWAFSRYRGEAGAREL